MSSKRKTFVRNSILGLLSWLLPIVPTLFATPIVLGRLGTEQYGLLIVLIGFISYFFTTAIGRVAAKYVAEYRAAGNPELIAPVISATLILGAATTSIGLLVTLLFAEDIVVRVLLVPEHLQATAIKGLYLSCATILAIVIGQAFQFVLQGIQRFDRYLLLANLSSVLFSLGSIALVLLDFGLLALLWWNLATWLVISIASYWSVRRSLPEYRFTVNIPPEIRRNVLWYAASIGAYQICGNVLLLFERGWLMRSFGAEAVAYYAVPMTLAMFLHLFTASVVMAMFPAINELLGESAKLRELYERATKSVIVLLAFACASIAVCGELFLTLWLGEAFASMSYPLLLIHTATFAILALNTITWQVAESFHAAYLNALATLFWMAVGITIFVTLSGQWGLVGVATGRLVGVAIFIPLSLYVEHRFLKGIGWSFWASTWGRAVICLIPAILIEAALLQVIPAGWAALVAAVFVGGVVYLTMLVAVRLFDTSEINLIRTMLRSGD